MFNEVNKVLFLACCLPEMDKEEFDQLFRNLVQRLQDSSNKIDTRQKFVTLDTIQDFLLDFKPNIVHIVGHKLIHDPIGIKEDYRPFLMKEDQGVVLVNDGIPKMIPTIPLANLFKLFSQDEDFNIQALILDSCYKKDQAVALNEHVPYVIGLKNNIKHKASIAFARGFYKAIAQNKGLEFSFGMGQNRIEIEFGDKEKNKVFIHI